MRELVESFKTDRHPLVIFDIATQLPRINIMGQPLPIALGIEHDIQNSTAQLPPLVELKEFTITLTYQTKQVAMGGAQALWARNDDKSVAWNEEETFVHWKGNASISRSLDLRTLHNLDLPSRLAPTFKTFSIARSYTLTFKCAIECAKERRRFELVSRNFVVLSSEVQNQNEST